MDIARPNAVRNKRIKQSVYGLIALVAASALALGLSHLSSTEALLPLTPLVATRTLVLSTVGGAVTGWLYWRRGLEAAMLAHGVVSFVLHVAAPGAFG